MKPLLIISADGHAGARPLDYAPFIEAKYRPFLQELEQEQEDFKRITGPFSTFPQDALDIIDKNEAIRTGGVSGAWDMKRRIQELDREGVAAEIVQAGIQSTAPPFFGQTNRKRPPEFRAAGRKAYHRWFADFAAQSDGRVFGIGDPGPCHDMDETVAELHWLADNGFVSVGAPGIVKDVELPPLYDRWFEPFWAVCEDRSLVISIHAGHGYPQGSVFDFAAKMAKDSGYASGLMMGDVQEFRAKLRDSRESPFYLDIRPRRAFWQMMLGGVFDRYPGLRVNFSEVRADWLPGTLDYLDRRLAAEDAGLKLTPSEYFRRNAYVTPSSPRTYEVEMRHILGTDRMMFGADYPHPEGAWPNSHDWLRIVLRQVSEREARLFLGENALRCYGLDEARMRAIADRIGPAPDDLVGSNAAVDERVVAHFHTRSNFLQPAESVDTEILDVAVGEDLANSRQALHG